MAYIRTTVDLILAVALLCIIVSKVHHPVTVKRAINGTIHLHSPTCRGCCHSCPTGSFQTQHPLWQDVRQGHHRWHNAIIWRPPRSHHNGWLTIFEFFEPRPCQSSWWICFPCWTRHVRSEFWFHIPSNTNVIDIGSSFKDSTFSQVTSWYVSGPNICPLLHRSPAFSDGCTQRPTSLVEYTRQLDHRFVQFDLLCRYHRNNYI